jgi:hypothetical protein
MVFSFHQVRDFWLFNIEQFSKSNAVLSDDLLILPTTPDVVSLEPMLQTAFDLGTVAT